jgi:hypothetical protein
MLNEKTLKEVLEIGENFKIPTVDKWEYVNRLADYIGDSEYADITPEELLAIFNNIREGE